MLLEGSSTLPSHHVALEYSPSSVDLVLVLRLRRPETDVSFEQCHV